MGNQWENLCSPARRAVDPPRSARSVATGTRAVVGQGAGQHPGAQGSVGVVGRGRHGADRGGVRAQRGDRDRRAGEQAAAADRRQHRGAQGSGRVGSALSASAGPSATFSAIKASIMSTKRGSGPVPGVAARTTVMPAAAAVAAAS